MTEEEVWALPARFHVPVFMESSTPKAWVCAVCWGDGWSTMWPCKTALDQGLRVFTADDYAETRAKRDAAELAEHRADANTPLVVSRFDVAMEPAPEEEPGLTVGAVAENGRPVALVFDPETRAKVAAWLAPASELAEAQSRAARYSARARSGQTALQDTLAALLAMQIERDEAQARVAELETELTRYVAAEPTRAYPPALPWAALMDPDDLAGFLRDLDAGMRDAARQAHFAGRPQAPAVLTALEHACSTWRLIAETQHAHNTAPGPDAGSGESA